VFLLSLFGANMTAFSTHHPRSTATALFGVAARDRASV